MKKYFIVLLILLIFIFRASAQNIGIGTNTPVQKLHVAGGLKIGNTATADSGSIRWNPITKDFEGYNGSQWLSFTGEGSSTSWGSNIDYATENGGSYAVSTVDTGFGNPISLVGTRLAIAAPLAETGIYKHAGKVQINSLQASGQFGNIHTLYSPTPGNHYFFGNSISVNPLKNDELVIGEPGAIADNNTQQGKAYLYVLNGSNQPTGSQELPQMGGDPFDRFGSTVTISGDYIAVAAPDKGDGGFIQQGKVYTYRRVYILGQPTNAFASDLTISSPDGQNELHFGTALSISPTCLVIGAPNRTVDGDANAGKVYIYRRINNTWQFEIGLTANNPTPNDLFGQSVSINVTGDTLLVGAPGTSGTGYAMAFVKNGASWQVKQVFQGSGDAFDGFGTSVHMKYGRIIIGANDAKVGINYQQGKAYLYGFSGTSWVKEAVLTPRDGDSFLSFGSSVQLGQGVAVVGAPGYFSPYFKVEKGRVYWFFNQ